MTEIKLAPCHPDVPRPSNDELVKLCQSVVDAIEVCGASPALTSAVILASELKDYLRKPSALPAHQQRVVDEYHELFTRTTKLSYFFNNPIFLKLPADEQVRLNKQWKVMQEYGQVLSERIAAF